MLESSPRTRIGWSLFLVCSLFAGVLFVLGIAPVYRFELDQVIVDVADRCPAGRRSDAGFDHDCAEQLIHRGPLVLGIHELAASFVFGLGSLVGSFVALEGHRARRTLMIMAIGTYLSAWGFLLAWNAYEGARLERTDIEIAATEMPTSPGAIGVLS